MDVGYVLQKNETKNTLGAFLPAGLTHDALTKEGVTISEFQACRLMEAGYRIVYVGNENGE